MTYAAEVVKYAASRENFLKDGTMGTTTCGGGSLVRMRLQEMSSIAVTRPALARTELPKPKEEWSVLLSMIGWTMEPTEEPHATIDMANVLFFLKWCETTAMLGT